MRKERTSQLNYVVITNDATVLLLTKAISHSHVFAIGCISALLHVVFIPRCQESRLYLGSCHPWGARNIAMQNQAVTPKATAVFALRFHRSEQITWPSQISVGQKVQSLCRSKLENMWPKKHNLLCAFKFWMRVLGFTIDVLHKKLGSFRKDDLIQSGSSCLELGIKSRAGCFSSEQGSCVPWAKAKCQASEGHLRKVRGWISMEANLFLSPFF